MVIMGFTLTREEIEQLTGRQLAPAQSKQLNHLGIEHRRLTDGTVVVLRDAAVLALGGNSASSPKPRVAMNLEDR
jgi:hypothetical protein